MPCPPGRVDAPRQQGARLRHTVEYGEGAQRSGSGCSGARMPRYLRDGALCGFPEGKTGFSVRVDQDGTPFAETPLEDRERQGVLEVLLDGRAKRPRPIGGVVPDLRQPLPGGKT